MTRFNLALATVLTAALTASSVPQIAQAQWNAGDTAMQERSQLYFNTYGAISNLVAAAQSYSIARSRNERQEMHIAASQMVAASSQAAYLAQVLNADVQAQGSNATAKELAPQLASLTSQIENRLDPIVAKGDLEALNKLLDSDETANALTKLFSLNKQVHQLIEG